MNNKSNPLSKLTTTKWDQLIGIILIPYKAAKYMSQLSACPGEMVKTTRVLVDV